jgi:hypothetical protein
MPRLPLYKDGYKPQLSPEDALAATHQFLLFCRHWAVEKEIPKRKQRFEHSGNPEDATRLRDWQVYLDFTEHAISELETGTLDHWFMSFNKG